MARVVVVGSINMDMVVATDTFPRLGETLFGTHFSTHPGGKGANQAVAAARLGAEVTMIGRVGADAFGAEMKATLAREGVDIAHVSTAREATGIASITLSGGDNAIIVVPGANHALSPEDIDRASAAIAQADVVLAQLEVPYATVLHAARRAREHGKPFFLNPAPAIELSGELLELTTLLTPNEHELATALQTPEGAWAEVIARAPVHGPRIAMTHGKDGAYYANPDAGVNGALVHEPGFAVEAVDTTGAGDTFNGALAAFWHLGIGKAVRRANAAAALSVTRAGAQGGMPTLAELEAFLNAQARNSQ
ncbi:ribokinase [Paraburkholderia silvatlantica]|uniref:Ribokinase n=1 Tax=Paraburkholderia silvatlantica TaxID=321895 RepID=A0A2V4TYC1_9BURK|nr:ribokinase [Paraburkholderia silvatlantica]PYE20415.1 ribokinase [Paraburkholderia silvatlantica]TDQ85366.1 ribokinase [Paraburkholderia silvatlantica]